ncbi:lysozyme RrrD [Caedimonas varicaedens]|uniref:Lysozyme n=1 Tax=Caedimonas varicaedens TaxID=1629334 RepID=A0A0K8MB38_9PROT|nr:lysozyme RrrD [Caedimonas varicaedens]
MIKSFEGFSSRVYADSGGVKTIGYGHALLPTENLKTITQEQALKLLNEDIKRFEVYLNRYIDFSVTQNQHDALVSFAYNVGIDHFINSCVYVYLKLRNFKNALFWWVKWAHDTQGQRLPGLVTRRQKEIELFNTPDALPAEQDIPLNQENQIKSQEENKHPNPPTSHPLPNPLFIWADPPDVT